MSLCQAEQCPATIFVYRWSGYNNDQARKEAGALLATLIDKLDHCKIITMAHSHGGNVANFASNLIKTKIDLMVHCAVPIILNDRDL